MVTRFDTAYPGSMSSHDYGDYVRHEDYEELQDKLADTECELVSLKEKIADIFREM